MSTALFAAAKDSVLKEKAMSTAVITENILCKRNHPAKIYAERFSFIPERELRELVL